MSDLKDNKEKNKREKCKFCHPSIDSEALKNGNKNCVMFKCFKHRKEDGSCYIVNNEICEKCEDFKSKYIEYPLTISDINCENERFKDIYNDKNCGKYVGVRICEENNEETYLGIFLGDFPFMNSVTHNRKTNVLNVYPVCNPAIFIPKLNRIVFGMESFWYELESPEDLEQITNEDIDNVWYVQAFKTLSNLKEKELNCPTYK